MDIVFVRHGESEANRKGVIQGRADFPLSPRGRDQALLTAEELSSFEPFRIYSSPLRRALETAEIINRRHNAPLEILPELTEYDLGGFEGLTREEAFARYPWLEERLARGEPFHLLAPRGEKDEQADARAEKALENILDSGLPRVLVVSHLGILERMLKNAARTLRVQGVPENGGWPLNNCSITRVEISPFSRRVVMFNYTAHLEKMASSEETDKEKEVFP